MTHGDAAAPSFAEGEPEQLGLALLPSTPPVPGPVEWKGLDVALFVAFSVVWLLLSQFLSLAGYAVLRPLMGWHTPPMALTENPIFVVAAQLVFYAPVLTYIILVVALQYHQPFGAGIRWRWPAFGQGVRLLLAGVLLAMVVLAGSALLPDRKDFPMEKLFTSPSAVYAVGGLAVLVAPFMEELVFRGVLFSFFERLGGFGIAVPATAVLFAALHYPEYAGAWTHVFMILVVGLVLSVARASTGSLVPSFLLHTAYNATFIGLLFLGTHGFKNLHGIAGGP
jgi:membrane protease YdiL (CAAX protease family)